MDCKIENSPFEGLSVMLNREESATSKEKPESFIHNPSSDQVIEHCTAIVPEAEYKEAHSPAEGLCSPWANYTDSANMHEEEMYCPNKEHIPAKSEYLLKQLGFSAAEYKAKMNAIKNLFGALQEVYHSDASVGVQTLGHCDPSIKSDEDQLLCLLNIKNSLYKFQNNSDPTDNAFTDKMGDCYSNYIATRNELEKKKDLIIKLSESNEIYITKIRNKNKLIKNLRCEIENLKTELSVMSANYNDTVKAKDSYIEDLSMEFKTKEQLHKTAISNKEKQINDANQDNEKLKLELNNMAENLKAAEEKCKKLEEERINALKKHNDRVKVLKERNMELESLKKSLEQGLDCEKRKKLKYRSDSENLEVHFRKLTGENKKLEEDFDAEVKKNKRMKEKIKRAISVLSEEVKGIPVETNVKKTEDKEVAEELPTPKTEITENECSCSSDEMLPPGVEQKDLKAFSENLFMHSRNELLRKFCGKQPEGGFNFNRMKRTYVFKRGGEKEPDLSPYNLNDEENRAYPSQVWKNKLRKKM